MGQERFSGHALLHIHYETNIDINRVIDLFAQKPRALEFLNICEQY